MRKRDYSAFGIFKKNYFLKLSLETGIINRNGPKANLSRFLHKKYDYIK